MPSGDEDSTADGDEGEEGGTEAEEEYCGEEEAWLVCHALPGCRYIFTYSLSAGFGWRSRVGLVLQRAGITRMTSHVQVSPG